MLTQLSVTNFKSWRSIPEMRLAPITGLFGTNSSGKTSILQLLLMLKQTADSADRGLVLDFGSPKEKSYFNFGTLLDVIYAHERTSKLHWRQEWTVAVEPSLYLTGYPRMRELKQAMNEAGSVGISYHATITAGSQGQAVVESMGYSMLGYTVEYLRKKDAPLQYELKYGDAGITPRQGPPGTLPPPVKCFGFPDQVQHSYSDAGFLSEFPKEFENCLSRVYYLGPLREYPQREYTWSGSQPLDVGKRGERVIDAILAARQRERDASASTGRKGPSLEETIARWLKELGLIHAFSVEPLAENGGLYQVRAQVSATSAPVLITDVGFGVSQVLPVLVLCCYVPEGSTILLEQPELHLHPSVQSGLADVFIDAVQNRNVQIVLESHSEHLLTRLQRRIAEEKLRASDAALYFCDMPDGASRLTSLQVDAYGNIKNWPDRFFGDDFGEMAAMTRAAMDRRERGGQ